MWTHYSANHTGFCMGLNKAKLISTNKLGMNGPIYYANLFPQIDPVETPMLNANIQQMNTKALDWQYEEEYRFTNIFDKENPSIEDRKVSFPNDFIDEVILSLNISKKHLHEIKEIVEAKGYPLFKIEKRPKSFLLRKVRI